MSEHLFKTSQGHFMAIEAIDHRKEAAAEEEQYRKDWVKFTAGEAPMPHHAYEKRVAYLDPGKTMVYYTRGDYSDGRAVPSKKVTRPMRDCSPLSKTDIRNVLELPRYYVKELFDSRVLDGNEYDELYKWAVAEVIRRNKAGEKVTENSGFPLFFYGLHPLFAKFVDGKLDVMRQFYSEGRYSWQMFLDPAPHAASAADMGGRVKKKQREQFQEHIEDAGGVPPDYVKYAVAQQYGRDYETIVKDEDERLGLMANAKPADCPTIPNISSKDELYTHQALALAKLRHTNEGVIDIDVGGGKLRILTFDAILCMKEGKCKRPLLVMPQGTIEQQKKEIESFTKRKINVFVINSDSWLKDAKNWSQHTTDEEGYATFKRLINQAPPNTIIISSYSWLAAANERRDEGELLCEMEKAYQREPDGTLSLDKEGNPVEIKQRVRTQTNFPRVNWLIDECGIDYVALDESHSVKNESASAGHMAMHFGSVPIKRIATGTITPNKPTDLWRQYAFLDPGIFRTKDDFKAEYASTTDKQGGITGWKRDAISEMRHRMLRHGSVSFRKAAWRHLLPKKTERFHKVDLRPNQQAVYKALMLDLLDEVERDPKLKEQWMKFQNDPKATKDIEFREIFVKLVRLDSLLTGMGQDAGVDEVDMIDEETGEPIKTETNRKFIQTLQGEDKISPKVAKMDEIFDAHFADPRNGKIVVFVQNELSARHLHDNSAWGPSGKKKIGWYMKMPKLGGDVKQMKATLKAWLDPTNKDVLVLVAVDKSLRTGHNFQPVCNRVIHGDMLWDPGNMEQRQGRIERPRSPYAEVGVFVDWIVTNNTAEVCKLARLLTKQAINAELNAGFTTEMEWPQVTMNPQNMGAIVISEDSVPPPPYIEWDSIGVHRALPHLLAVHEEHMSQEFRATYGNDIYNRHDPVRIKGSKRIYVPQMPGERIKFAKYTLGAEIVDENDKHAKRGKKTTEEVKQEKTARQPKIKIDHKMNKKTGQPFLEINDPKSIKEMDPEHLKKLGFKFKGKTLFVSRRSHLELKRIIERLKDFGYRVDYANSKSVPHINTVKDPRAPKAEPPLRAKPVTEKPPKGDEDEDEDESEDEGDDESDDVRREQPGQARRPPKPPEPGEGEDEDEIKLDDVEEEDKEPVRLELVAINDEYFYRLKEPKGHLEEDLAALQFKLERQHWYLPLRSWQHALFMVSRIKKLGISIDDEDKVMKSIQQRAVAQQLRPKGGFSALDIDKRLPRKRLKGTVTLYYAKIDGEPFLGVTDRESQLDLGQLRGVGFRPADRQYFWRRLQSKSDMLLVLKRMKIAGLKISNWDALADVLGRLKVSVEGLEDLKYTESGRKKHAETHHHHHQPRRFQTWGF